MWWLLDKPTSAEFVYLWNGISNFKSYQSSTAAVNPDQSNRINAQKDVCSIQKKYAVPKYVLSRSLLAY
jgi:hypothetical protein